jgi:esterase/lipase superfamily enzyme
MKSHSSFNSNNMINLCGVFSEIDLGVHGMLCFRDGSVTNIKGHDTVLIKCRIGGHRALTGVYHIPHLTTNIISLSQLEEASYKILLHGGFLKLWD